MSLNWNHGSQEAVLRIASVTGILRIKVPTSETWLLEDWA